MGLVVVISPVLTLLWTYQSCCSVTVDTELKRESNSELGLGLSHLSSGSR